MFRENFVILIVQENTRRYFMKPLAKRTTAGILCVLLLLMTACSGKKDDEGNDIAESEKGRYIETEYTLPEEVGQVFCLGKLADGTLRLVTDTVVYDSADGGKNWSQSDTGTMIQPNGKNGAYLMSASVDSKGRIFLAYSNINLMIDENGEEKDVPVTLPASDSDSEAVQGDISEGLDIANGLTDVAFTKDDQLIARNFNGKLHLIDPDSGEVHQTFGDDEGYITNFAVIGSKLVAVTILGVDIYNIETAKLEEAEPALSEYFSQQITGEGNVEINTGESEKLAWGETENTLYYIDNTGLYRYTFGAGEMERIINGDLCSMSNPANSVAAMIEMEDNQFLILYEGMNGYSLMHYEYSAEASAVPSKELKIYALEDNQNIRQAISNFQAANPDYYVNLEVGMSGNDSITASDALSTLNTNIMAGDGPDIILLDKMQIDVYIEKGLLVDLSDVLGECKKDSTYFEKVLYTNQSEDGVYAVPTRFNLPFAAGEEDDLKTIKDLGTLADVVNALRMQDGDIPYILGQEGAGSLLEELLMTSLSGIMKSDGTLDEAALTEFIEAAKNIYEANSAQKESDEDESASIISDGAGTGVYKNLMNVLLENQSMNIGYIDGIPALGNLLSMNDERGWVYQPLNGLSSNVFTPVDTVGISAKSENAGIAAEFIKYLLSDENQSNVHANGLPANIGALEQAAESTKERETNEIMISAETNEGVQEISVKLRNATDKEFVQFKEYLEAADTAAVSDAVITDAIVSDGSKCLQGESGVAEAVESIMNAVNLYLSE